MSSEGKLTRKVIDDYSRLRRDTEALIAPLSHEDMMLQSMADVSPTKWHIGHVTWFFEAFFLDKVLDNYEWVDPRYKYLFNSYYESMGDRQPRSQRGVLSRPSVDDIINYRKRVDAEVVRVLEGMSDAQVMQYMLVLETGIAHEEQHQELILTDIKYNFSSHPFDQVYKADFEDDEHTLDPPSNLYFDAGIYEVGADGSSFHYDNEGPMHRVYLNPWCLSSQLVTNGEYLEFVESGGYSRFEFWLSDGWNQISLTGSKLPLYWRKEGSDYFEYTLGGLKPLDKSAPVSHVNYYESQAYASFRKGRLPLEYEWEVAARQHRKRVGNFYGKVWQWTQSAYSPYPGFKPTMGSLGEYNSKFMCGQYVLKGSSRFTVKRHSRDSYRNFFTPKDQWQCSGIRLVFDANI